MDAAFLRNKSFLVTLSHSATMLKNFAAMHMTVLRRTCPRCGDARHIKPSHPQGYERLLTFLWKCVRCHRCNLQFLQLRTL